MMRRWKRMLGRRCGAATVPGAVALLMAVDAQAQVVPVPEPSTIALMAAGAVGAVAYGARKRRKK